MRSRLPLRLAPAWLACAATPPPPAAAPAAAGAAAGGLEIVASLLRKAQTEGMDVVVLDVEAEWCSTCHELRAGLRDNAAWGELRAGMVTGSADFDSAEGQAVVERYRVIELPTVLFLRPDGSEIGRIVGFDGVGEWLGRARRLREGRDDFDMLRARVREAPQDPRRQLDLALHELYRGMEREAFERLDAVVRADPDNARGAAAEALRLRGRYLIRVRRDHDAGIALLIDALRRFPAAPQAPGYVYWIGRGMVQAGRRDPAERYLRDWVQASPPAEFASRKMLLADFLYNNGYPRDAVRAAAQEVLDLDPREDEAWYLLAEVALADGDRTAASAAIERALRLEPAVALYESLQRKLAK